MLRLLARNFERSPGSSFLFIAASGADKPSRRRARVTTSGPLARAWMAVRTSCIVEGDAPSLHQRHRRIMKARVRTMPWTRDLPKSQMEARRFLCRIIVTRTFNVQNPCAALSSRCRFFCLETRGKSISPPGCKRGHVSLCPDRTAHRIRRCKCSDGSGAGCGRHPLFPE